MVGLTSVSKWRTEGVEVQPFYIILDMLTDPLRVPWDHSWQHAFVNMTHLQQTPVTDCTRPQ